MFRYLPSTKVFFVAFGALGVLFLTVVYQNNAEERKLNEAKPFLSTIVHAGVFFPDVDKDGLYDWEEKLYGTDPLKSDTNGNGVNDGEEYESTQFITPIERSDSVYVAVNKLGETLQNTPNPIDTLTAEPTVYEDIFDAGDVYIVSGESDIHREYSAKTLIILSHNTLALEEEPLEIIKKWLETYSQKELDKLHDIIEANMQTADALIEIEVPQERVATHLNLVNNLYKSAFSLEEIETTTLDPTKGFFAAANYANYQSKYINSVFTFIEEADHYDD